MGHDDSVDFVVDPVKVVAFKDGGEVLTSCSRSSAMLRLLASTIVVLGVYGNSFLLALVALFITLATHRFYYSFFVV